MFAVELPSAASVDVVEMRQGYNDRGLNCVSAVVFGLQGVLKYDLLHKKNINGHG